MIGLALEGGGVRGSYEAGAYMAMYEAGIKIDCVTGSSIGALNGVVIASGKGYILPSLWRSLSMGHVFGFSNDFIEAVNSKEFNLNLVKSSITDIINILHNKGISLTGLKKVIDKYLDVDALMNSNIDFGICTVRFKDLKPLYLFKKDMDPTKIKDYILASAYLPIFKREKLIDDNYYLDGGFYDLGPVNILLEKGYKKIYLVKVHGIGITKKYPKDADVTVIESKRKLGGVLSLDPKRVDENIKMGYYDAYRVIHNMDGEKYVFQVKTEKYYKRLNHKVDKFLYKRVQNFFKTENYKDTTIKALEYVMEHNSINYYKIYKPSKMIKELKKLEHKNSFIYEYINKLK